jgi:Dyp-type peroxidase family
MSTLTPTAIEPAEQINSAFALLNHALSPDDVTRFAHVLGKMQGNILRAHGRHFANHILVRFRPGSEQAVKAWLRDTSSKLVSAQHQLDPNERLATARTNGVQRPSFRGLLLSAKGYRYLGLDTSKFSKHFVDGMASAAERLNDNLDNWEGAYRQDIHAIYVLADDNKGRLATLTQDAVAELAVLTLNDPLIERGSWQWRSDLKETDRIEHFGYQDGRSNPIFFKTELEEQGKGSPGKWDSSAAPNLACVMDPFGDKYGCGSYFVFQKLEQDVKSFVQAKKDLVNTLGQGMSEELAGALIVGRFENAEPLLLTGVASSTTPKVAENDFDYRTMDRSGDICPVFSHIRKMNPRGTSTEIDVTTGQFESLERERSHRIVRRGIPYGERTDSPHNTGDKPSKGVGLLFMCCQADIAHQFEVLQGHWANSQYFPFLGSGIDPLIGRAENRESGEPPLTEQLWPEAYKAGLNDRQRVSLPPFVRARGGEYFFAPSKSFFEAL